MKISQLGEFGLIDRIARIAPAECGEIVQGIGDDAAAIRVSGELLVLVATDAFVEGVHFNLDYFTFYQLGWRALAANVSDIAAMGGSPTSAVISLALPKETKVEDVENFYRGVHALAEQVDVKIVGGDTVSSTGGLFISITLLGEVEESNLKLRSRAKPGDVLLVTGSPGSAEAGRRILARHDPKLLQRFEAVALCHLMPASRVECARFLVKNFEINAMIDLSDGLAAELHHICKQSNVGSRVFQHRIVPAAQICAAASYFDEDVFDYFFFGGEDYELLFTAPPSEASDIIQGLNSKFDLEVTQIGVVTGEASDVRLYHDDHNWQTLSARGFDHFLPG